MSYLVESTGNPSELEPLFGYAAPEDLDLFAYAHPVYRKSQKIHGRMWDAVAEYQWLSGTEERGDIEQAGNEVLIGEDYYELFKLTPSRDLDNHFLLGRWYPGSPNAIYFLNSLTYGGIELNLDTAKLLLDTKAQNPTQVPGLINVGPRTQQFLDDYIDFRRGTPIELGRNDYVAPSRFSHLGRQALTPELEPFRRFPKP